MKSPDYIVLEAAFLEKEKKRECCREEKNLSVADDGIHKTPTSN